MWIVDLMLLASFFFIAVQTMIITANFERNQLWSPVTTRLLSILFIPYLLPIFCAWILSILHQVYPFYHRWTKSFYEMWMNLSVSGIVIVIASSAYVYFSGGNWNYETKAGQRDLRYKNNYFTPYYDDGTKKIALNFLLLPILALICTISYMIINHYIGKK